MRKQGNSRSLRAFMVVLITAAFLLRLAAVLALRDIRQGPSDRQGTDGVQFNILALQVVNGNGYSLHAGRPTSFRAPGFPLFLCGVHLAFEQDYRAAYFVFCLLGALACGLTYLLAREVLADSAARLAAILVAVYPPHVYFTTEFASENLFVPVLTLGLWMVLVHLRTASLTSIGIAGLALGWAALTRPFAVLIPPVLIGIVLWSRRKSIRNAIASAALLLCGFSLVVLPWTVRNYVVHRKLVWIATNGGSTFYGGNNDWVISSIRNYGGWVSTRGLPGSSEDGAKDEVERDRSQWRRGKHWVESHIRWMPALLAAKYVRLWLPDIDSPNRAYVWLNVICTTPFLLLILVGQFRMTRSAQWWSPSWLVLHGAGATTAVMTLITWGSPRFRDANATLLMVYAVVAVVWIARRGNPGRITGSRWKQPADAAGRVYTGDGSGGQNGNPGLLHSAS